VSNNNIISTVVFDRKYRYESDLLAMA